MTSIGEEGNQLLELSDLPNEILIRILTLLSTEDAVWTCLLLFRRNEQQHLWKSLTSLEFYSDGKSFFLRGSQSINFMERIMELRDHSVPLVSFSLYYLIEEEDEAIRIERVITKAVQSNVEELTLFLNPFDRIRLPCCIFGCQSLVKLDLCCIAFDVSSSVVCLPRLKYLTLYIVKLVNGESTEMLLSSPYLEELTISHCSWCRIESISVSSANLQVLKFWDDSLYGNTAKICVIGDNLKYFSYKWNPKNKNRVYASSSSTQLTKVEIYVKEEMFGDLGLNCYGIIKGLIVTRNLALSDHFLEGLYSELLDTFPTFECLTRLDIQVYKEEMSIHSLALMKIFSRCPHLEYLNIGKLSNTEGNQQLSPIPLCFQTSLKKILVHYNVPKDKKANAAIDVLLKSALVLEELVIYCVMDPANRFHKCDHKQIQKLQDRFNRRPRVSKDCIISVRVTYSKRSSSWLYYYNECYVKSMSES